MCEPVGNIPAKQNNFREITYLQPIPSLNLFKMNMVGCVCPVGKVVYKYEFPWLSHQTNWSHSLPLIAHAISTKLTNVVFKFFSSVKLF